MAAGRAADLPKDSKGTAAKRPSKAASATAKTIAPGDVDPMDWPNWRGPRQN
jgi:hypothetical protein